jgi:hypothetical protein
LLLIAFVAPDISAFTKTAGGLIVMNHIEFTRHGVTNAASLFQSESEAMRNERVEASALNEEEEHHSSDKYANDVMRRMQQYALTMSWG